MRQLLLNTTWPIGEEKFEVEIFGWEYLLISLMILSACVLLILKYIRRK